MDERRLRLDIEPGIEAFFIAGCASYCHGGKARLSLSDITRFKECDGEPEEGEDLEEAVEDDEAQVRQWYWSRLGNCIDEPEVLHVGRDGPQCGLKGLYFCWFEKDEVVVLWWSADFCGL